MGSTMSDPKSGGGCRRADCACAGKKKQLWWTRYSDMRPTARERRSPGGKIGSEKTITKYL